MPLYEYECQRCLRHTDRIEKVSGPHLKKCPHCGGKVERVLVAPAIQFKGAGWYVTDYAGKSSRNSDSSKSEQAAGGDSGGAGESKAEAKESSSKETKTTKKK